MVKKTRKHRGGGWFDGLFGTSTTTTSYSTPSTDQGFFSGVTNLFSNATQKAKETGSNIINATEGALSSAQQGITSAVGLNTQPTTYGTSTTTYPTETATYGGKKRRRGRRTKKGGRGLGLTYYATPIEPGTLKVAQPTYWINVKGGKRRRKTRKHKKH